MHVIHFNDKLPKIIVTGHGRHGKDTVCDIIYAKTGLMSAGSSEVMNEVLLYPLLKKKYGYKTKEECFDDRHNHRQEWFEAICNFNKEDPARLGRLIFKKSNIYCGLRNKLELDGMIKEKIVDHVIWVDASKRKPDESSNSMTISREDANYVIDNNKGYQELEVEVKKMIKHVFGDQFVLSLD